MPLSDEERRQLEELERSLRSQDPALARALGSSSQRQPITRRGFFALLIALAGIVGVFAGIASQNPIIGIVGFLVMCAGTSRFITSRSAN